jgi:hypothetical protein
MARATRKTKNKAGEPYSCCRCADKIIAGQDYYEWKFRYGGQYRQHALHGAPKQSHLTQSKMSGAYAAIEAAQEALVSAACAEDIAAALNDCASGIEDIHSEYQDGLDNMPDGLREAAESGETGERMQALEEFKDELESVASDIEGDSEPTDEDGAEGDTDDDKVSDWLEDLKQKASDALGSFSM